jgi:hypothetical protein
MAYYIVTHNPNISLLEYSAPENIRNNKVMSLGFRCVLSRNVNDGKLSSNDHKTFWFDNVAEEEGGGKKRCSFHIKPPDGGTSSDSIMDIEKPCFLVIDCASRDNDSSSTYEFMFGAIEIYSNSRNIEVYAVLEGKDANDREYWQTYRGNKMENESGNVGEVYQTIILPPSSKSVAVRSLHCKLLSIRPSTCKHAVVQQLMLKGRLPEIPHSEISVNSDKIDRCSQSEKSKITPYPPPSAASSEPIAKAVSALTMMIHNVQSKFESSIQSAVGEFQSMTYSQHQQLVAQMSKLEIGVNEVKAQVEKLNDNLESLRSEIKLQNNAKELNMIHCHLEQMKDQSNNLDKEYIRSIIQNEYKIVLDDFKEQNKVLLSQLKDDLFNSQFHNSFMKNDSDLKESEQNSESMNESAE